MLVFGIVGCEESAESQIQRVFDRLIEAEISGDDSEYLALLSRDSIAWHAPLIAVALDGTPAEVRALPPIERLEVLTMRHRSTRDKLTGLSAEAYVRMSTREKWFADEPGLRYTLKRIKVSVDTAQSDVYVDGKPAYYTACFIREDDEWKFDLVATVGLMNAAMPLRAREFGLSLNDYLISLVEDNTEEAVSPGIWNPMPKPPLPPGGR